jgi:hypothetical protein
VYLDELVLRLTCQDDGMKFAGPNPKEQGVHLLRDALGTTSARPFIVDVLEDDPMQLASAVQRAGFACRYPVLQTYDRLVMIEGFVNLYEVLPTLRRKDFINQELRFTENERVTLNRCAAMSEFNPQLVVKTLHESHWQRTAIA